jgi:hypothetical protein
MKMSELDEIKERMKEAGVKPKRKLRKREKWMIIGVVLIIVILLGAYIAMVLTAPTEKYWKPDNNFKMPAVDWSTMKSSYVVERTTYDQDGTQSPPINQTIGSKKSDGNFEVEIVVNVYCYIYTPHNFDSIRTMFYVSFTKLGGDYRVKELVFKYEPSDSDVRTPGFYADDLAAKNLYFTAEVGNYPTPYGSVSERMDYELWTLHQIKGINKDMRDIKDGGFSKSFQIDLYDPTTSGKSHNITFHAILHYGKYVHGFFGENWEDVHTLEARVMLYIVPEGGA